MATHSTILAWRIPWTEGPGEGATVHGEAKSRTRLKYLSLVRKKNLKKHVHVTESLCRTPETKATLEINYTSIFKKEKGREGNEDAECK